MKTKLLLITACLFAGTLFAQVPNSFNYVEAILTTGSSDQTIITHTPCCDSISGEFEIHATVQRVSDGATKVWGFVGGFSRKLTAGASVFTQPLYDPLTSSGDALALLLATVYVDVSGNDILVRVKGLSGTDMIWHVKMNGDEMTRY